MTGSLIGEIIERSISNQTSLSELLRMVKVAAYRLNLPVLEDWVTKELNGYEGEVPDYRRVKGQVVAKHIYHGWRSVGGDGAMLDMLQERSLGSSVAQLEAMVHEAASAGNGGTFTLFFDQSFIPKILGNDTAFVEAIGTRFSVAIVSGILDRVRSKILDWAIEMDKNGIVGQGMTFTPKEKADAAQATTNIILNGSIGTFAGNIGAGNVSGAITATSSNVAAALEVAQNIQESVQQLIQSGADPSLSEAVENLTTELASTNPDKSKVQNFIELAKTALAGASGSLLATGAIAAFAQIASLI